MLKWHSVHQVGIGTLFIFWVMSRLSSYLVFDPRQEALERKRGDLLSLLAPPLLLLLPAPPLFPYEAARPQQLGWWQPEGGGCWCQPKVHKNQLGLQARCGRTAVECFLAKVSP
eukprot:SAG31_NODE_15097_length_771_cov_1.063988_1_plen_114_part_00